MVSERKLVQNELGQWFSHQREIEPDWLEVGVVIGIVETFLIYIGDGIEYEKLLGVFHELGEKVKKYQKEYVDSMFIKIVDVLSQYDLALFDYLLQKENLKEYFGFLIQTQEKIVKGKTNSIKWLSALFKCQINIWKDTINRYDENFQLKLVLDVRQGKPILLYPRIQYYNSIDQLIRTVLENEQSIKRCQSCFQQKNMVCKCICQLCSYSFNQYSIICSKCYQQYKQQYIRKLDETNYYNYGINKSEYFKFEGMPQNWKYGFKGTMKSNDLMRSFLLMLIDTLLFIPDKKWAYFHLLKRSLLRISSKIQQMSADTEKVINAISLVVFVGKRDIMQRLLSFQPLHTYLFKLTELLNEPNSPLMTVKKIIKYLPIGVTFNLQGNMIKFKQGSSIEVFLEFQENATFFIEISPLEQSKYQSIKTEDWLIQEEYNIRPIQDASQRQVSRWSEAIIPKTLML